MRFRTVVRYGIALGFGAIFFGHSALAVPKAAAIVRPKAPPLILVHTVKQPEVLGPLVLWAQKAGHTGMYSKARLSQLGLAGRDDHVVEAGFEIPEDKIDLSLIVPNDRTALIFFYRDKEMVLRWSVLPSGEIVRCIYARRQDDSPIVVSTDKYSDYLEETIKVFTNAMRRN